MRKFLITLIIILNLFLLTNAYAWNDCPYDKTNDTYPGDCGRYTDTNNDDICDHSQPKPTVEKTALQPTSSPTASPTKPTSTGRTDTTNQNTNTPKYHLVLISIFLVVSYSISMISVKKKLLKLSTHKKIWNLLLLLSFLATSLLGLLLVLKINYQLSFTLPFNMLSWHVETGIIMTIISIFHVLWHLNYYLKMFKKKND